jgi:hypothetical protein
LGQMNARPRFIAISRASARRTTLYRQKENLKTQPFSADTLPESNRRGRNATKNSGAAAGATATTATGCPPN